MPRGSSAKSEENGFARPTYETEVPSGASHPCPRLYRAALGILRDADRADDATQAALFDVWKYLRRLRDPEAYESWSYRLLVGVCVREAKGAPRWMPEIARGPSEPPAADDIALVADRDQLERGFRRQRLGALRDPGALAC